MCGVAALLAPVSLAQREDIVREMCAVLSHRGPHGAGLFSDGELAGVTLGHRRLSILDLSPTGAQPMPRGSLCISYNGEFYDYIERRDELATRGHRFIGRSDTEVLLALCEEHGVPLALAQVNGMFAFALFDRRERTLWLARDRFGEKPLYYLTTADTCVVASEPKAILAAARRLRISIGVNRQVLACYLADAEHEVGEATFFAEIRRVRPGEWLRIAHDVGGRLSVQRGRYYDLSESSCPPILRPQADADEEFRGLLTDAVRIRLRSDVPVAACLSGGLDSSSLVGLAAQVGQRLHTFSATHRPGEPWDERRHIAAVIAHTGVENVQVNPEDLLDGPGGAERFLAFLSHHDEPVGGPSVWAQHCVYRLLAQHGHRVALSGQGADESLGGYGGTLAALRAQQLSQRQWALLRAELAAIASPQLGARAAALRQALLSALRLGISRRKPDLYQAWLQARFRRGFLRSRYFDVRALCGALPPLPTEPPHAAAFDARSLLHGYLYRLLVGTSLSTILRFEDRNSMMASVESRAPFLDPRLIAHCLGRVPSDLAGQGDTKLLLRRALPDVLPPSVRMRRDKVGFGAPPWRWLTGPLRPWLDALLSSTNLRNWGFLRASLLRADWGTAATGGDPCDGDAEGFFRAINVAVWLNAHALSL